MVPRRVVGGQRRRDGVASRVVGAVALGDRPLHHRADAPPDATCGFPFGGPDRQQDSHHVGGGDLVHGHVAELGQRVGGQARTPLVLGLAAVLPVAVVYGDHRLAGFGKGGHALHGAASGIVALDDAAGVLERPFTGHSECDDGIPTEADACGLAVDADALRPAFGEAAARGWADEKAKAETAAPVAVAAGDVDGSDEGCGEHFGSFHRFPLLVRLQGMSEMECAEMTRVDQITLCLSKG